MLTCKYYLKYGVHAAMVSANIVSSTESFSASLSTSSDLLFVSEYKKLEEKLDQSYIAFK